MMFTSYFIKKKIQALASEAAHRTHRSLPLDDARSLLIFYNIEDHQAVMKHLEPLRKAKKVINTCVYVADKNVEMQETEHNILINAKTDLNAWCFPTDKIVEKVKALQADILIDLSRPACYPLQYVALQHPSAFKVGIKYPEQEWYDLALSITDKEDIDYLFGQILFYLRTIGTK